MSTKSKDTAATTALLVLSCSAASAIISFWLTRRAEERKILREKKEIYDREIMIKEKTIEARKLTGEPTGKILDDVTVDRVYLWEVEDLKHRFNSSQIENKMQNVSPPHSNPYFFPSLNKESILGGSGEKRAVTSYNKLITNHECVLGDIIRKPNKSTLTHAYVRAGPRRHIHFNPKEVNAAIVTCGGLCPGLNNVIREITKTLIQAYGIGGTVYGIQGGYRGFYDFDDYPPIELTTELVQNIHHEGGTVLATSRGGFDLDKILGFLESKKISQLYVIGGDGTHRGAFRIHEGCMEKVSYFCLSYV